MNFAVHLPVLDWLFGTFHLPRGRWPASYGLASGERVPTATCVSSRSRSSRQRSRRPTSRRPPRP